MGSAIKENSRRLGERTQGNLLRPDLGFEKNEEYGGQRWRNLDSLEICSGSGPTQFTPGLDINHDKNAQSRMTPRYFGFLGFVDSVLFYT